MMLPDDDHVRIGTLIAVFSVGLHEAGDAAEPRFFAVVGLFVWRR